jgi:hypothetical protein
MLFIIMQLELSVFYFRATPIRHGSTDIRSIELQFGHQIAHCHKLNEYQLTDHITCVDTLQNAIAKARVRNRLIGNRVHVIDFFSFLAECFHIWHWEVRIDSY